MANVSRKEARDIVEDIMTSHGGITAADRAATPASVLRSLESVRENFAKATTVLSQQLYSKDTRFVYEIIQNAEDNAYEFADETGTSPELTFAITPDHIVIDSNEDGFTEENVRAICKLGGSTKSASRGFIGEKGIGFKSVFKIASRVRVQSGPFCFAFDHGDDDHGLGMVTPINDEHEDLPANVRTRFTLTLNQHSSFGDRVNEFQNLPDTLLLFLTKLQRIVIGVNKGDGVSETVYKYNYDALPRIGSLCKRESIGNSLSATSRSYYMERKTIKGLPPNQARPRISEAEVVLAFPIDEDKNPVIEQQHVFAYLPMRRVGFNFQIQSDFITQASREDLFDSAWNRALLDGVAATFQQAVLRFRTNHPLEFSWMRYLPSRNVSEEFWANLCPAILGSLRKEKILQVWYGGCLEHANGLRHVSLDCRDAEGEPLFREYHSQYLSPGYSLSDVKLLSALGVRHLSESEFCKAVSMDLDSSYSTIRSDGTSDDWHSRVARKLLAIAESDPSQVQDLYCIPLQDGGWASAQSNRKYLPTYRTIPIPTDLGLRLVRKEALTNAARKQLFSALGVKSCSPKTVTPLILQKYNSAKVDLQSSVSHLRWLYHFLPEQERALDRRIPVFASDLVPTYQVYVTLGTELRVGDLYFETEDKFGVKELCRERKLKGRKIYHEVHFINEAYMDAVDPATRVNGSSWLEWLQASAGVRRIPRLVQSFDSSKLSDLFLWLVSNRPSQITGTLHVHWPSYKEQMKPEIVNVLRKAKVLWKGTEWISLEATWMPTCKLWNICQDFDLVKEMPLLKLSLEPDSQVDDWRFLKDFGVGFEATTTFYLQILRALRGSMFFNPAPFDNPAPAFQKIMKAYRAIEMNSNSTDYDEIRQVIALGAFFLNGRYIALPPDSGIWYGLSIALDSCLWRAPAFIDYRHVLASYNEYRDDPSTKALFTSILRVPNIECEHYIEQLLAWKAGEDEVDNIAEVYGELTRSVAEDDEIQNLRQSFESDGLIYVPIRKQWFSPSSCMWTKSTRIAGKVAIALDFPSLKDFFVRGLGVQEPDKSTCIMELETLCRVDSAPSIAQVKEFLWEINSYEPSTSDMEVLKPLTFLPIREATGELRLHNIKDIFVLFDRQGHTETFQGKVASLDFDIEDIRLLRPLIKVLGLASRYTSKLAEEKSCAPDAVLEPSSSNDLRSRAYAIFRCAVHYQNSTAARYGDSLHQRLREAEVYLSDDISSTVELVLNGMAIAKQSTQGRLHFQDDGDYIRLYVPRDAKLRELSYLTDVPERIVSHFEIKDQGAAKVFGDALKCSLIVLDDVLKSHGIVRVPGILAEPAPQDDQPTVSVNLARNVPRTESETRAISPSSTIVGDTIPSVSLDTEALGVRAQPAPFSRATSPGSARMYPIEEVTQTRVDRANENYRALLDHVIKTAQNGRGHVTPFSEGFVPDNVFGVRSTNQLLHDMKIGAAGELYAFEFLLDLLPNFSRANWRSNIRKYVCVHEEYSDMTSYDGSETADIIYDDVDGVLTRYLASLECIDEDVWRDKTPKYLLEVKTTTQECDTRFFMSKSQVQRMERMMIPPGEAAAEIYVIMRVSNLCQSEIDLEFIVDPETRKRNGELRVTSESYTISHTCQLT